MSREESLDVRAALLAPRGAGARALAVRGIERRDELSVVGLRVRLRIHKRELWRASRLGTCRQCFKSRSRSRIRSQIRRACHMAFSVLPVVASRMASLMARHVAIGQTSGFPGFRRRTRRLAAFF